MTRTKTVDVKAYKFSEDWLKDEGFHRNSEVHLLAEMVQDICEEYVKELKAKQVQP